jgi:hypothetical protein
LQLERHKRYGIGFRLGKKRVLAASARERLKHHVLEFCGDLVGRALLPATKFLVTFGERTREP